MTVITRPRAWPWKWWLGQDGEQEHRRRKSKNRGHCTGKIMDIETTKNFERNCIGRVTVSPELKS